MRVTNRDYIYLADHGLCGQLCNEQGIPSDIFFADSTMGNNSYIRECERTAKEICKECPVRMKCLEVAIANSEVGIWGGTTDEDRNKIRLGYRHVRVI
jgi:hypothetical protein